MWALAILFFIAHPFVALAMALHDVAILALILLMIAAIAVTNWWGAQWLGVYWWLAALPVTIVVGLIFMPLINMAQGEPIGWPFRRNCERCGLRNPGR